MMKILKAICGYTLAVLSVPIVLIGIMGPQFGLVSSLSQPPG